MSALSYEVTTGIADELKWLRVYYNSSVINVIISLGILVPDMEVIKISELSLSRNSNEYKVWDKSNKLLFHAEMFATGSHVETFKRGLWEDLLEKLSRDKINGKENNDESDRDASEKITKARKPKTRTTG